MIRREIIENSRALHTMNVSAGCRSRSRDLENNKKPAAFLQKIYEILTNPIFEDIICFLDDGITFVVKNTEDFCREVLPYFFKHTNFRSFTRQLNLYGFKKIRNTDNNYEFHHKYFRRNDKNLMQKIMRKNGQKMEDQIKKVKKQEDIRIFHRWISSLGNELQSTKDDLNELERSCLKCTEGQNILRASVNQIKQEIFQCQVQRNLHNQLYQQILSVVIQRITSSSYQGNQNIREYSYKNLSETEFKKGEQFNETENHIDMKPQKYIHNDSYQQSLNLLLNVNQRFA